MADNDQNEKTKNVINSILEQGQEIGNVSESDILKAMGDLEFNPDQIDELYDSLESSGVEISSDAP